MTYQIEKETEGQYEARQAVEKAVFDIHRESTEETLKKRVTLCHMRITGNDKNYYYFKLAVFQEILKVRMRDCVRVEYGKQDIRGSVSITVIDSNHCVPMQKHFATKQELLGFVCGYVHAYRNEFF